MNDLSLQRIGSQWLVMDRQDRILAEIGLDHYDQVNEVVIGSFLPEEIRLLVLQLAASHVSQYVKHRVAPVFGGIMTCETSRPELGRIDSDRLMDFAAITPKIKEMGAEVLIEELNRICRGVIDAVHPSAETAIDAAIKATGVKGLRYDVVELDRLGRDMTTFRFRVKRPRLFAFWNSASTPGSGWDLEIVPDYHPLMLGKKSIAMVNGDTDYHIRGYAVERIFCPTVSQAKPSSFMSSSWTHVKHPYRAIGRGVDMAISLTRIRSAQGIEELVRILRAALAVDDTYVEISGGFRAPLQYPGNRLLQLGRESPRSDRRRRHDEVRGSEGSCVWQYRVLQKEGVLEKAHIPPWFTKEGWLGIYKGAETRVGIF